MEPNTGIRVNASHARTKTKHQRRRNAALLMGRHTWVSSLSSVEAYVVPPRGPCMVVVYTERLRLGVAGPSRNRHTLGTASEPHCVEKHVFGNRPNPCSAELPHCCISCCQQPARPWVSARSLQVGVTVRFWAEPRRVEAKSCGRGASCRHLGHLGA